LNILDGPFNAWQLYKFGHFHRQAFASRQGGPIPGNCHSVILRMPTEMEHIGIGALGKVKWRAWKAFAKLAGNNIGQSLNPVWDLGGMYHQFHAGFVEYREYPRKHLQSVYQTQ
jgi:hypothetical protein